MESDNASSTKRILAVLIGLTLTVAGSFGTLYLFAFASIFPPGGTDAQRLAITLRRLFLGEFGIGPFGCVLAAVIGVTSIVLAARRSGVPNWWMWVLLVAPTGLYLLAVFA